VNHVILWGNCIKKRERLAGTFARHLNRMKNMKNRIVCYVFLVVLFCIGSNVARAQNVALGVRFMPTFSSFDIKTSSGGTVSGTVSLGFGVGALVAVDFSKHFGVQGEIIYSSLSQEHTEQDIARKIKLRYVNIPLLLTFNTGRTKLVNFNVVAGPQIGLNVGSSLLTSGNTSSDSTQAILAVRKGDIGIGYGLGLDFGLNPARTIRLDIGFRGVLGLFDISDNNTTLSTNSYYILDRSHVKANAAYLGLSFIF
jgi:Outer membrane protein beta-barrel domain